MNAADATIFSCDKSLKEFGDKLSDAQKTDIENAKNALKDALDRKDVESCKSCMETLNNKWHEVSSAMYGQSAGPGQSQSGNPFEDAGIDFEEVK